MSRKYLNQQSGYSLAGLMASVAITVIVALGAAYVIISAQKTANFSDIQNEIDRAHYLNLQLSRNPAFILRQPGFEKTGALYSCLQHSPLAGVNCLRLQAPPSYVSETKITSLQQNLTSSIAFLPVCKMPTYCDSITMTTVTGFLQSSLKSNPNFQARRSVSMIPGYVLVPRTGFNFNCVLSQGLITQLNFGSSQALCQPLSGTLSDPNAPLTNFGPVTPPSTQTMTNQDCGATGFSSIGSFQDQASCMVPVAVGATTTTTTVTTTTLAGGPTTTTTLPCPATATTNVNGTWNTLQVNMLRPNTWVNVIGSINGMSFRSTGIMNDNGSGNVVFSVNGYTYTAGYLCNVIASLHIHCWIVGTPMCALGTMAASPPPPSKLTCCSDGSTGYIQASPGYVGGAQLTPSACASTPGCVCDASSSCCVQSNGKHYMKLPVTCM